jgi:hypothetical protein
MSSDEIEALEAASTEFTTSWIAMLACKLNGKKLKVIEALQIPGRFPITP